jgi:Omp85 superfamily domain
MSIDSRVRRDSSCLPILLMAAILIAPGPVEAQDTRAAEIAAEQAEKATRLAPREPTAAERLVAAAQRVLVEEPSGVYPYFDSVYSGGGFTLGGGYRQFTGDRAHWNLAGLYSAKAYKLVEGSFQSPGHAAGLIDIRARVGWRDATQVAFHGLGIDSPADLDTAFRMRQSYGAADVALRPLYYFFVRGGVALEAYDIADPTGGHIFVEDVFAPEAAPGVGVDPTFLHLSSGAGFDWRPAADYARRGGLYEISHHRYGDRDDVYSFNRVDVDLVQHLPILRENWVISLRGGLQSIVGDSDQAPYFLLPSLGSGSTLRAYSSWRFRDRHAVLTSAEFRWIASPLALDMALFYDAGTVAAEVNRLSLGDFVSDYGIGVRFHGPVSTPLRIELARGREGFNIVFAASAAF